MNAPSLLISPEQEEKGERGDACGHGGMENV